MTALDQCANMLSSFGNISVEPQIIPKQSCTCKVNIFRLTLFSLCKNYMHNVLWDCAEILPQFVLDFINKLTVTIFLSTKIESSFNLIISCFSFITQ